MHLVHIVEWITSGRASGYRNHTNAVLGPIGSCETVQTMPTWNMDIKWQWWKSVKLFSFISEMKWRNLMDVLLALSKLCSNILWFSNFIDVWHKGTRPNSAVLSVWHYTVCHLHFLRDRLNSLHPMMWLLQLKQSKLNWGKPLQICLIYHKNLIIQLIRDRAEREKVDVFFPF